MVKFRYYIIDLTDGMIEGTDSEKVASEFFSDEGEGYAVIDTERGAQMYNGAQLRDIGEAA